MALNLLASTGEQKVDAGPASTTQTNSAVASLADGGWIVTWASNETTSGDIYGRLYESDGGAFGSDFVVNKASSNAQSDPDVAGLPNGGWVVTWTSLVTGDKDVFARTFDGQGTPSPSDLLVNTTVLGTQHESSVAAFADNAFVVAWSANEAGSGGYDLKVQKFALDGTPLGALQSADLLDAASTGEELRPAVVARPNGSFIAAFEENYVIKASDDTVHSGIFSFDGGLGEVDDPGGTIEFHAPAMTRLTSGDLVVVYHGGSKDGSGDGVFQQRLHSNGTKSGSSTQVNATINNDQSKAKVAALADGGYVVVWQSKNQDGDGWGVYQQRYDAGGAKVGGEALVNATTGGDQLDPDVAALSDGSWVVTWTSNQNGAADPDIYQRRFTPGLTISNDAIDENAKSGTIVGIFDPASADGKALTFSLLNLNVVPFKISGNKLILFGAADHEDAAQYTLQVRASAGGEFKDSLVTIKIGDIDEAPEGLKIKTGGSIEENKPGGTFVAKFGADDPEGKALEYTLKDDAGGLFTIDKTTGNLKLASAAKLDFEQKSSYSVKVMASDGKNAVSGTFDISVLDINEGPTVLSLSGTSVKELAATGAIVGTLTPTDPDKPQQTYKYDLANDAGGRFAILGDKLVVNNGVALDFEQAGAHQVTVVATDQGGLSKAQNFIVTIGNVSPEKTFGTDGADTVFGDIGKDVFSGGGGNDILKGFKNADTLTGGAGNDKLFGGLGKDKLLGGKGKDVFVFDTKPASANVDTLKDYSHKDDTVWLENAIFKGIGSGSSSKPKKMKADAFFLGKEAHDASDRILYDKKTGGLWYDADGSGSHAAVKIAVLTTKPALTLSDFYVI